MSYKHLVGGLIVCSVCLVHAPVIAAPVGKAVLVLGSVKVIDAKGVERRLKVKGDVFNQDTVVTDQKGQVMIKMTDNSKVSVRPTSRFTIENFTYAKKPKTDKAHYKLVQGGMRALTGIVGKSNKESFRLNTPVATMGIRGTDFSASYCQSNCGDQKGLFVNVLDGGVTLSNDSGNLDINPGEVGHLENSVEQAALVDDLPESLQTMTNVESESPTHESEIAAIAFSQTEEVEQVVNELIEGGAQTDDILSGAIGVGLDETQVLEPIMESGKNGSSDVEVLMNQYPEQSGNLLAIGIANRIISIDQAKVIAEKNAIPAEQLNSAIALGNLIAPLVDSDKEESNNKSDTGSEGQPSSPGAIRAREAAPVDPFSLPVEGDGGGDPASPS